MRAIRRSTSVLLMGALMTLAPTIGQGGLGQPEDRNKGPFNIDPRTAEPDTEFDLDASGDRCGGGDNNNNNNNNNLSSASAGSTPDAVLLGNGPEVEVQVVDPDTDQVLRRGFTGPDGEGDWDLTIDMLMLPEGTYLVTAFCDAPTVVLSEPAASASSEPAFVLLGGSDARCTEPGTIDPGPEYTGSGCYEPQDLVIEVAAAEPVEREPTFTG